MNPNRITVLYDVLNRLHNTKQCTFTADDDTLKLCKYELESIWKEVPIEYQSNVRYDRIEKVLDSLMTGQELQAKDLSGSALADYKDIQQSEFEYPSEFRLKYWNNLSEGQKKTCLQKLESSHQSNNKGAKIDKQNVNITTENDQPKHVSTIMVSGPGKTNNSSNERPSRQRTPNLNEKQHFPESSSAPFADADSKESKSNAPPSKDTTTTAFESESPGPINKHLANEGTPHFDDTGSRIGPSATVSVEQTKDTNWKQSEPTTNTKDNIEATTCCLHSSSTIEDIAKQFMVVYTNHYRPLFKRLETEGVKREAAFENLLSVLKIISEVCKLFSEDQIRSINECLIKIVDSSSVKDKVQAPDLFLLFEFRRLNARLSLETLIQKTLERCKKDLKGIQFDRYNKETKQMFNDFLHASIEVVWYMAIQERPCVLVFDAMRGTDPTHLFHGSTDTFKRFQQVVWPAVMSDQYRNVLEKGVGIFNY